jgi:hypothetical protein
MEIEIECWLIPADPDQPAVLLSKDKVSCRVVQIEAVSE